MFKQFIHKGFQYTANFYDYFSILKHWPSWTKKEDSKRMTKHPTFQLRKKVVFGVRENK